MIRFEQFHDLFKSYSNLSAGARHLLQHFPDTNVSIKLRQFSDEAEQWVIDNYLMLWNEPELLEWLDGGITWKRKQHDDTDADGDPREW